jgi:hypothetical protein
MIIPELKFRTIIIRKTISPNLTILHIILNFNS